MNEPSPATTGEAAPLRRPPLLVTGELPPDVFAWADGLRRAHFPPERNRLRAHVTLFHALPNGVEAELRQILGDLAAAPPPQARISGLMKLGGGTALAIESPELVELHGHIAERMHGLMTRQDAQPLKLHITIQNKVTSQAARQLQDELGPTLEPRAFRFHGFGLYAYEDGLWRPIRTFAFRG
ncbi:2'-5' RNA ligase [Novosphingobium chloroacetimidivorans]|uniref:2'-5' RNA ligase n=1 Tax=Novosphingobium chloroacetimidivorans TaxID=1428314 RepID=A0A7W7NY49_9SPHN|nr:2'-5' RNA ligase family protein [Novosphingobium chloroacetimidivorans]MBB4859865.1 2'-5' RNA ligase [Novosphingobium chloroacetimidivorans]